MPATNGGRAGPKWQALEAQVLAEETHCCRCGRPVDKTLPRRHRWGATIDHLIEIDRWPEGIYLRSNVRLAHGHCNYAAGSRYRARKAKVRRLPHKPDRPSRNW